jgi:queuine tRNA-ribosyltransferase
MPTRNGRNALLFTYNGTMNMRNKKWENDFTPIDPDGCYTDQVYTKAYLHHLYKAQELLAMQIGSIHNLAFYLRLVTDARQHIEQGDFVQWKRSIIDQLGRRI